MHSKPLILALPAAFFILSHGVAHAGEVAMAGAIACVTDKWDEKEVEKGHKIADYAGRCIVVPDDLAAERITEDCVGKYEYLPDGSWKGSGGCTRNFKGGDKIHDTFEEGSHLKEYMYTTTGGTGKFKGVSGGGAYTRDDLSETLSGGRIKDKLILP